MSLDLMVYIYIAFVLYFFLEVNEGMSQTHIPQKVYVGKMGVCLLRFYSYQETENTCKFIHVDTFSNSDAMGDQVGLAITQSLSLAVSLQFGVRYSKLIDHYHNYK